MLVLGCILACLVGGYMLICGLMIIFMSTAGKGSAGEGLFAVLLGGAIASWGGWKLIPLLIA